MPQSRHRRKGRTRPRERHTRGPERKPDPSPKWVPITGLVFVLLGFAVVVINYIPGLIEENWVLFGGFGLMAVGALFLMRYR